MIISQLSDNIISKSDKIFLKNAANYFNIKSNIHIKWNDSKKQHPDIWITLQKPYTIYITQEWRRQKLKERHKRLVHELYHIIYRNHWNKPQYIPKNYLLQFWNINTLPLEFIPFLKEDKIKLLYSTYPVKDSFSWYLYYCILFNKDYKKLITQSNDIIPLLLCLGALILFMSNHISFII